MSASVQQPKVLSATPLETSDAKWLALRKLDWVDQDGKQRAWECASRKTRAKGGVDAVAILAVLHAPGKPTSTLVIEQYRPPIGRFVVELPAGLIDEGEQPAETAVRELREETGYGGDSPASGKVAVRDVSPVSVNDPGMTDANMHLVTLDVQLPEGKLEPPKADLEEGEHIVTRIVPLAELYKTLQEYDAKPDFTVDARLAHLAYGLSLTKSLGL